MRSSSPGHLIKSAIKKTNAEVTNKISSNALSDKKIIKVIPPSSIPTNFGNHIKKIYDTAPILNNNYKAIDPTDYPKQQIINDLEFDLKRKNVEIENLKNKNLELMEENNNIRILTNKIGDKNSSIRHLEGQINFFKKQIEELKAEKNILNSKLETSENNLQNILKKSKEQFLVQTEDGQFQYLTRKELDLMEEIEKQQNQILSLQKEKDKYYLNYYEELQTKGELHKLDLDESLLNMTNSKYKNNLQMAEMRENQLKLKISIKI